MKLMFKIEYSPYKLKYKNLNKFREGALLKFDFDGLVGYADCHPWEELGDVKLKDQLSLLKQNKITPLIANSIKYAFLDAKGRAINYNFFKNLKIPKSHFLINHIDLLNEKLLLTLQDEKFSHIKIKLGNNLSLELEKLQKYSHFSFIWRFDFNSKIDSVKYCQFIHEIKAFLNIDLSEDPFTFENETWKSVENLTNISLALDRNLSDNLNHNFILVIKPAIDPLESLIENIHEKRFYLTTYLDHPLGQSVAAYFAGIFYSHFPNNILTCGLLTHKIYEENPYSIEITTKTNEFSHAKGNGFGFDELLKKEKWQRL